MTLGNMLLAQGADRGSWPTVLAAFDEDAEAGRFYGPTGLAGLRGKVGLADVHKASQDDALATGLWDRSVKATEVTWSL